MRSIWRRFALLVTAALLLSGCGKSLSRSARLHSGAALGPSGAAGLVTQNTSRLGGSDAVIDAAAVARVVHPGLTERTRPQAVVLVDAHSWPAALAASVLASAPLRAPILYSEGDSLPQASAQALAQMRPIGTRLLGGAQIVAVATAAAPRSYSTRSLQGGDPAQLAAEIESLAAATHDATPREVIVTASDGEAAFAMPAAGLAAQTGAPILFVRRTTVPAATSRLLQRLRRPRIFVVGPASTVSQAVFSRLARYGPVRRIAADDPAANAIAVARFSEGSFGWGIEEPGHGLAFASVSRPLDAPAAAALSASGDYAPLLLLDARDRIPGVLVQYLRGIQPGYTDEPQYRPVHGVYNHGWVIGDEQAITAATQAQLDALLEISQRSSPPSQPLSPASPSSQELEE